MKRELSAAQLWACIALPTLGLLPVGAVAQNSFDRLTQYSHSAYRIRDGAIVDAPNAIAQTTDGYLWIGTNSGLTQFDGIQFVTRKDFPSQAGFKSIFSLSPSTDGSLWIGTWTGVIQFRDGKFRDPYSQRIGRVNGIVTRKNGSVWIARTRIRDKGGPLCELKNGSIRCFGEADGLRCRFGQALTSDGEDDLWIGSNPGVCRWSAKSSSLNVPSGTIEGTTVFNVQALSPAVGGGVLIGYSTSHPQLGLHQVIADRLQLAAASASNPGIEVTAVLTDKRGAMWIGTANKGLIHVSHGSADRYTATDGLSSNAVTTLYEDSEGTVWVGTLGGLDSFHPSKVVSITTSERMVSNTIHTVMPEEGGGVLVGGRAGINKIRNGFITEYQSGIPFGSSVNCLMRDHSGTIWAAVDDKLGTISQGVFRPLRTLNRNIRIEKVKNIIETPEQEVWAIGTVRGVQHLFRVTGMSLQEFSTPEPPGRAFAADPKSGFWLQLMSGDIARYQHEKFDLIKRHSYDYDFDDFTVWADGTLWAWGGFGLLHYAHGNWQKLNSDHGLPCDSVYDLVEDKEHSWWLYQSCGIAVIAGAELEAWSSDPRRTVALRLYLDSADGAHGALNELHASAVRSSDGRLWFANTGPLQSIDPEHLPLNSIAPTTRITALVADGAVITEPNHVQLPPLIHNVEIEYAAPSFIDPQKVVYRYRIAGIDRDWQEAGMRRQAFYMNLPPGSYRFEAVARNSDGEWNTKSTAIDFGIRPAFYQTSWFRAALFCAAGLLLLLIVQMRVRFVTTRLQASFRERQSERIRIARDLHDTLLQGVQSLVLRLQAIANTLPEDRQTKSLLEKALDQADKVLVEGRDRVRDLRSADETDTDPAEFIRAIGKDLQEDSTFALHLSVSGEPRDLSTQIKEDVFAIAKEAITNACRHADPKNVWCELKYEFWVFTFTCKDDGRGISPEVLAGGRRNHWGLVGMEERAKKIGGTLNIQSSASAGTVVELSVGRRFAYKG